MTYGFGNRGGRVTSMTRYSLSDRTVLVTGASGGIGLATARMFAERGARVFGTSRSDRANPRGVTMVRLDVRSANSVERCVGEILSCAGHLDVLVNNAGVMHQGFAEETNPVDAAAVLDVNFFGADRVIRAVLPSMRERRGGRIINVGSLAAWVGEPAEAFYAASKAALARYTEALRQELLHLGITVCLVEPGAVRTGVLEAGSASRPIFADYDGPRESAQSMLQRGLERGADPATTAALIVKVAATRAPRYRYATGVNGIALPLVKTLLPQRLFEYALRRGYHMPPRRQRSRSGGAT